MSLLQSMSTEKKKKQRKPKTKRMYFGPEVDLSIIKYNNTTDEFERSVIYSREIKTAFEKLAENIIHTFKFYYTDGQTLEQVQHEVVSFMVERLYKFKPDNGKAFSYYSIIAKHFLIQKNKENYKKLTSHDRIDLSGEITLEYVPDVVEFEINKSDFQDMFVKYWDDNLERVFLKKNTKNNSDLLLAASIIELFRKRDKISIYNKKALYIYIRSMHEASTQQITKMVKIIKVKYKKMYADYIEFGYLPKDKMY
jgi:hypothetical protein